MADTWPLAWVTETKTVDAIDTDTVKALDGNPGWRLLSAGHGAYGQVTLTYGWPWPDDGRETDGEQR